MRRAALLFALLAPALAACGGEGETFSADEFVRAVNQRGASLALGPALRTSREDAEVYALALTGPGEHGAEEHGGGSLTVTPSSEAGLAEYERCERAVSLLCFQADNIVLILEADVAAEQQAALARALQAIERETSG